jgi:sRNA-binding regulator protein Hfq
MDYRNDQKKYYGGTNGGAAVNGSYDRDRRQVVNVKSRAYTGGPRKPAAPKGHDAELKEIQDLGLDVAIEFLDGQILIGKLVGRDKFTLKIKHDKGSTTYYKHAIKGFTKGE